MRLAIGVDLGGTKIEAALVNEDGRKLDSHRLPTGSSSKEIANNLKTAVEKVMKPGVIGIGIGTPGFVSGNTMGSTHNVPGLKEALDIFKETYPNIIIENDANCFALAEHKWGAGRGSENIIGVIWGTGIGGGLILNGKLVKGAIGGCGEIGKIIIDKDIEVFHAMGPGTWEYYCSGPNIVRRYIEAGGDPENHTPDRVWEADDSAAETIRKETLKYMGIALGSLVNVLNPELIVMGGGVSNMNVYDELNALMKKFSIDRSGEACRVVSNQLGDSSGVLGAASLLFP